jgi:rare lipoprotein A
MGARAPWRGAALEALPIVFVAISGCATTAPRELGEERGDGLVGMASWYGARHHGRSTASGQPFDMHQLSAAHRTLPLGTRVRVTNLENRRSVVVRVTDRGPFVPGRIVDLSYAAAKALDLVEQGIARVRLDVLPPVP